MSRWDEQTFWKVNRLAREDAWYQELKNRLENAEGLYLKIKSKLPEQEQLALEEYISLCEEVEYRKSQLAYEAGLQEGKS